MFLHSQSLNYNEAHKLLEKVMQSTGRMNCELLKPLAYVQSKILKNRK